MNQICTIADIGTFGNLISVSPNDLIENVRSDEKYSRFDTLVVMEDEEIIGAVNNKELRNDESLSEGLIKDVMLLAAPKNMMSAEASVWNFFMGNGKSNFKLVFQENRITGIVTISDILKPPMRMMAFSIILYLEDVITKLLHSFKYTDDFIRDVIGRKRFNNANKLYGELCKSEIELSFLDSLQLTDKKLLLIEQKIIRDISKTQLKKGLGRIEKLRNHLAHGRNISDDEEALYEVVDTLILAEELIAKVDTYRLQQP